MQVNLTHLFGLSLMPHGSVIVVRVSNAGHTLVMQEKCPEKVVTLYIKNTFSGEVTGSCWLFSSHFSYAWSYAWNEMKNQLLTFPNKSITLQQLSTL